MTITLAGTSNWGDPIVVYEGSTLTLRESDGLPIMDIHRNGEWLYRIIGHTAIRCEYCKQLTGCEETCQHCGGPVT